MRDIQSAFGLSYEGSVIHCTFPSSNVDRAKVAGKNTHVGGANECMGTERLPKQSVQAFVRYHRVQVHILSLTEGGKAGECKLLTTEAWVDGTAKRRSSRCGRGGTLRTDPRE